jgi:hypothetical protein
LTLLLAVTLPGKLLLVVVVLLLLVLPAAGTGAVDCMLCKRASRPSAKPGGS